MSEKYHLLVAVAIAALAMACGDPANVEPERGQPDGTTPAATIGQTPEPHGEMSAPGDDQEATLDRLLEAYAADTHTAKYAIDTSELYGQELEGMPVEMTVTEVRKGNAFLRETVEMAAEGEVYSFTVIVSPDVSAICAEEIGMLFLFVNIPDKTCVDLSEYDDPSVAGLTDPLAPISDTDLDVVAVTTKDVNGASSTCYEVAIAAAASSMGGDTEPDEELENGILCWDDAGRLVYFGGSVSTEGARTLVEFTDSVSSDAFDLPYSFLEPQSLLIRNETSVPIFVNGSAEGSDWIDAQVDIEPGESGTLRSSGRVLVEIYLGTYQLPQWNWGCTWEDAKANEPLVVKDESANCSNTSTVNR